MSLGEHYVSTFLDPGEADGISGPLDLVLCQNCRLLQLKHTVPAGDLYQNYWYRSGTNQTMRNALADIAHTAEKLIHLQDGDAVLDIGCNDGTLLSMYQTNGIYKIGIDPAKNIVLVASKTADKVIADFFTADLFQNTKEIAGIRPRVITSIAMFYDLEDPKKFVADIRDVLHSDGLWIVQMSYLPLMLKTHELGNICHEHLEYYSMQSLEFLLDLFDFEVVDVELNDVNGGSLRAYIRSRSADPEVFGDATYRELASERVTRLREQEIHLGLDSIEPYREFAIWVERIKNDVVEFIKDKVNAGNKVYIYGASTKGNTVLQYYGLDQNMIVAASERNPQKWGKVTVGTHIPIVSEAEARAANPDYFLVLPWHFLEEFKIREKDYLLTGGRFIMPAPYFTLV
ncbi:MAG: methyltransferase domain-containing protein [Candidatus Brocadiales bacterium]|nr:methyltransferase domain-containing protein [Candidatus Brocadiales bacterium]